MPWLGLIELFVVLAFALVWGLLELYTLRLDRKRAESRAAREDPDRPTDPGPAS